DRLGLTPAQLGELIYGVPKGLIEGWEKGRYLQNREADSLLRSLEDREVLERRASVAGITLPVTQSEGPATSESSGSEAADLTSAAQPSS
ncbi:MAG TPA: hypothetical protein VMM77_03005, partial [Gemmatimonadaceae bacterium]|nr:hypothetical protein [Gemmatimonadaceae bacterium]